MRSLIESHRYNDALRLAILQSEVDEITQLMRQRGDLPSLFKCFNPAPPKNRSLEFVAAIRNYDWNLASTLATTADERQDIEDSIARVSLMTKLMHAGRYGEALEYAIQQSEVDELSRLKEKYGEGRRSCLAQCFSFLSPPLEPVRTPQFIAAIRNCDWTLASELAVTLEERKDIEDSIARVSEMDRLKAEGRYDEALKLAVLTSEANDINDARNITVTKPRSYTASL